MGKRCAYGVCNSDNRYPERVVGVQFIPFPKPKSNLDRCLRWIKACNRPHDQLNVNKVTKNTFICSKHFHGESGPTDSFPDPIPHTSNGHVSLPSPARQPPKRRKLVLSSLSSATCETPAEDDLPLDVKKTQENASQTESPYTDPLEFMGITCENERLKRELSILILDTENEKRKGAVVDAANQTDHTENFDVRSLITNPTRLKYYTGFTPEQFRGIQKFLIPDDEAIPIAFPKNRTKEIMAIEICNQLLLTLMKLRHNFDYADLGYRFGLSKQTVGVIFTQWVNYMYLRFGEVSIWPPRDTIFRMMPSKFAEEFPTTFAIMDCTEIKICKPSSLKAQSQTYSDYKSTNTLKGLVACDPRGSIIFSSMLFSGAISDKAIFEESGCKKMLKDLVEIGFLNEGDGIMADKGFNIESDVTECGLKLNIPPFARAGVQMSQSDALLTKKIAAHRVHVERAIARIKRFKILSGRVQLSLLTVINQIWYVCSFLTNFFMPCIQDKE
ncbi:uncharacterized protein [Argopecten irradians]|uniref:uncharacterized protein n=2 Tax=Argopecten irradians TaxID=31199 RepID=UPI00371C43BE